MTTSIARVTLNGVEVGSLPAETYYTLIAEVRGDSRLYVAQTLNLLGCVWRLAWRTVLVLPATWFTLLAAVVVLSPTEAAALVVVIREATPEILVYGVARFLTWTFCFTAIGLTIKSVLFGRVPFGYVNQFDQVISDRVRQCLEVPAEGDISVVVGGVSPA